jgi:hypothetical protein
MSENTFMKTRSGSFGGPRRMGDQGRARVDSGKRAGGDRKFPDGQYDYFYPGEVPTWINISAFASFIQEIYDRKEKEVIEVETTWFESQKHYIPRNKNRYEQGKKVQSDFICSSGPYKKEACWGCAVRTNHYAKLDAIEAEKGIRPNDEAPVSRMSQFSLAITVMEKIYAVPSKNKDGTVKKAKTSGKIIYNYIPAPKVFARGEATEDEMNSYNSVFGHRMHWTLGQRDLTFLIEADDKLRNNCGNCADQLFATSMICPGCETQVSLPAAVTGADLQMERQKIRSCAACGERAPFMPAVQCGGCGVAVEGRLTNFDLRITRKKVGNEYITEIVSIRIPGHKDPEINSRIKELIAAPLDLASIFAPTPLDRQKYLLGQELTKGVKPTDAIKRADGDADETDTESYADGGDAAADNEDSNREIKF